MKVVLGVSGSIAAVKAPFIVRRLKEKGFEVKVVLSEKAKRFVTPLSLSIFSGNEILDDDKYFSPDITHELHLQLEQWGDLLVVAPASANFLAKCSVGLADDLLTVLALSWNKRKIFFPAMHSSMWKAYRVRKAVAELREEGVIVCDPKEGALAVGTGVGRMAEPEEIVDTISSICQGRWKGKRVIVTAGATREPIDPVRFITNRSSGKMGLAIAEALALQGAEVLFIHGVGVHSNNLENKIEVATTKEMLSVLLNSIDKFDPSVLFMAAAPVDYAPEYRKEKIKKTQKLLTLELTRNPDIIMEIKSRYPNLKVVGFAAESSDIIENACTKLLEKGIEIIVANDISRKDIGFTTDYNEVTVITEKGNRFFIPKTTKKEVAYKIVNIAFEYFFN